ncbi:MAG TPA: hypothetical protein P5526_27580, partial [Anaerolineae bacterium]|nr:hypothetical protein [Anaerolineae bacterium]
MNRQLRDEQPNQALSAQLERAAPDFPYPPLPDIEQRVNRQLALEATSGPGWSYRWGWAAVTVGIILLGVLAVPPVRAALVEMLQLGAVRIFLT